MRTAAELLGEDHAEVSTRINTIIDNRTRPFGKRLSDGLWASGQVAQRDRGV